MSGRTRADETVRVRGSNPAWLDRDREARDARAGGGSSDVATKVHRHRAGRAPAWATGADADAHGSDGDDVPRSFASRADLDRRAPAAPAVLSRGDDGDQPRAVAPPRVVRAPQIVSRAAPTAASEDDESTASEEEEDEAEIERRRAAVRARAAARRRELEEEALPIQSESESESEPERARVATARSRPVAPPVAPAESSDGSSSWETDTDASDSEDDPRKMIKPVFVPKKARETLAERERVESELDAEWERREARRAKRAEESRTLAELEVQREEEIETAEANAEASDVDTDDDVDPEGEYAAWRLRELARIEEERERREHAERELEEQERLRAMSEEEKAEWLAANPREETEKEKTKMGFMQKYYHKGAFFQEAADDRFGTAGPQEIYKRDFSEATGADRGVDKSNLPRAMQVRGDKFGKMGQTKWTHLAAEDTSRLGEDPFGKDPEYRRKTTGKQQSFEKPKHLK